MKETLGGSIKKLRKSKNMTLKSLAQKTGFSISFLSQLERGKSSATLESLKKISLVLGVNPGYFFQEDKKNNQVEHSPEKDQLQKHKIYYKSLSQPLENPAFSPHKVILEPGQNEGNLFEHSGQEFLYVLEGELTVQINNKKHVLHKDDSLMFDSGERHYWYNYSDCNVKFLCVNYDVF